MEDKTLQKLNEIVDYMSSEYDDYNLKSLTEVIRYEDKIAISVWACGAIVYIDGSIYYITEDDGDWWVEVALNEDIPHRKIYGYMSPETCIGWAKDIANAYIRLVDYIEAHGKPVYYVGIDEICYYKL